MPQLPSTQSYIFSEETDLNSPNSEQTIQKIGQSINFLNDYLKASVFLTSSGNFTVPSGITRLLVFGWGGGQSGYSNKTDGFGATRSVGGQGAVPLFASITVTPEQVIAYTIGAGGATNLTVGATNPGGNTTFGPLLFSGAGLTDPVAGSVFSSGGLAGSNGGRSVYSVGGLGGSDPNIPGGGGGAGFGQGGNGGSNGGAGQAAPANSGGGGGGGSGLPASQGGSDSAGGAGGSGGLIILY